MSKEQEDAGIFVCGADDGALDQLTDPRDAVSQDGTVATMTTKQEARAKISAAEVDCAKVQAEWGAAVHALGGTVNVNGFGIYRDRSQVRAKLLDAQSRISAALQALEAVEWPTDADYDLF